MMIREFFLGFIKIHTLYHASKGGICGIEIIKELKRHGYAVSPGTLYPTLHALERDGYLKSRMLVIHGKRRRYYKATKKGISVLKKSRERLRELVEEVME
ncbi:MAG: helix-turn-helix transcriptional regulator [Euryarchaeota archaeon]|nr:helix-turn-helix transcriptional regulator [Euryarchaeota archaeon]